MTSRQPEQRWRKIRVGELAQDPRNLKRHDERNKAVVGASLDEYGQVENYVVEMGTDPLRLLGGNMRAARDLDEHGPDHEVMICEVDVHGAKADKLAALR